MKYALYYLSIFVFLTSCKSNCFVENNGIYRNMEYFPNGKIKYGFSDVFDNMIIPFKYNNARQFNEGLAAVANDNNKYGFINKKDSVIIPFKYDYAGSFGEYEFEGLAIVKMTNDWFLNPHMTDGLMGFINHQGEPATQMVYKTFGHTREFGLFRVTNQRGKFGWLDKKAKEIIPCEHDSIINVSNGVFTLRKDGEVIKYDNKGAVLQ